MESFTITWCGEICGNVEIHAQSAEEAKIRLASLPRSDLIKGSNIWHHQKPVSIESIDTRLGLLELEAWETICE